MIGSMLLLVVATGACDKDADCTGGQVCKDHVCAAAGAAAQPGGVPVRLSVMTTPPVQVRVLPPASAKNRQPLDLGRTPIDAQSGAFVGDTLLLVNEDRGIRYEERIETGQPNELKLISKVFKEKALRVKTTPPLENATVWRGNSRLGQLGVYLSLFPGTHELEIRCEQLVNPHRFTVMLTDGARVLDWVEDVSSDVAKR